MQLLNGEWQFTLVEGKRNMPPCFFTREFGAADWGRLPVPSNWQRQGWGMPVYSNSTLDVEPDEVGLYRRAIALPEDWQANNRESRIILHLAGVKTAFHVYLNGREVGYDVIRDPRYSNLHGGFIWDFKDQGWRIGTPTGDYFDWGKDAGVAATGNDGFDGVVDSLLNPNGKIAEVAKVYQDIHVESLDAGRGSFVLHNHHSFLPLSAYRGRYRLQVNGADLRADELTGLSAPAGGTQEIKLDAQELKQYYRSGDDVRLLFEFSRTVAERGTPQGHITAWDQLPLQLGEREMDLSVAASVAGIELIENQGSVIVRAGDMEFALNKALGRLLSWKLKGRELLSHMQGPQLNLWRAPTDADDSTWGGLRAKYLTPWKQQGIDEMTFREGELEVVQVNRDRAVVDLSGCLAINDKCTAEVAYRYSFLADGRLAIAVHFAPGEAMQELSGLPRLGLTMHLQNRFGQVEWFGRGPHENYRDRRASARVGRYRSTVEQLYVPYVPAQANGNRSGVHWLEVTDMDGTGLRVQRLTRSTEGHASYFPKGRKPGLPISRTSNLRRFPIPNRSWKPPTTARICPELVKSRIKSCWA